MGNLTLPQGVDLMRSMRDLDVQIGAFARPPT
jgi:hypothetical protein